MKHSFLDQYSDRDSFVHRLDPRTKFITTLVFILAVISTPPTGWQAFVLYLFLITTLIIISKVTLFFVFKRSLVIFPFVVLVTIYVGYLQWYTNLLEHYCQGLVIYSKPDLVNLHHQIYQSPQGLRAATNAQGYGNAAIFHVSLYLCAG